MSSPITIGSDRYNASWYDWWIYSVNYIDCKKRLMNLLLDVNDLIASVESGKYDNKDIFDILNEIDKRAYLSDSAISCYPEVSSDSKIQQLQKDLHIKIARLHQLKKREFFLLSIFESIGAIMGFSFASKIHKGITFAQLDNTKNASNTDIQSTLLYKDKSSDQSKNQKQLSEKRLKDAEENSKNTWKKAMNEAPEVRHVCFCDDLPGPQRFPDDIPGPQQFPDDRPGQQFPDDLPQGQDFFGHRIGE